jgi:hypothetical protein
MPRRASSNEARGLACVRGWLGWLGLGWLGLAMACHPRSGATPPGGDASDPPGSETTPPTDRDPAPAEPTPCGAVGERFEDHAWAPSSATTVASVQVDSPELTPALRALAEHVRAPGHGLPIPLSFSLGEWSWQVPVLVSTLRQAGFRPAELAFVSDDAADHAWLWRSTCDLEEAIERIETAWAVDARRTVEGVIATPRAPAAGSDALAFPYDVLVLPGERMALVPAGRASAVLDHFGRPGPSMGLGGLPAASAGRRLDELLPAPVRLVVLGRALLDPAATVADHEAQALRVTGEGVEGRSTIPAGDASLPPP